MGNPNREIAIRLRERYEFYFVALAFTTLALSIQTAHFDSFLVSDIAELAAWVTLLLAGILGLRRIESAYAIYDAYADLATLENERRDFEELKQRGVTAVSLEGGGTVTPAVLVSDRDATIASAESAVSKINKNQVRAYQLQRILFVGGLAFLMISRGYQPALSILARLLCKT